MIEIESRYIIGTIVGLIKNVGPDNTGVFGDMFVRLKFDKGEQIMSFNITSDKIRMAGKMLMCDHHWLDGENIGNRFETINNNKVFTETIFPFSARPADKFWTSLLHPVQGLDIEFANNLENEDQQVEELMLTMLRYS